MKIDWKIIRNWALGEASEKEKQEVERWGEMGEENRNFLEDTYNSVSYTHLRAHETS